MVAKHKPSLRLVEADNLTNLPRRWCCKWCGERFVDFNDMYVHAKVSHAFYFHALQRWLDKECPQLS